MQRFLPMMPRRASTELSLVIFAHGLALLTSHFCDSHIL